MAPDPRPVTLAVTIGDPRGIGPEVVLEALRSSELPDGVRLLIVGSLRVLEAEAANLGLDFQLPVASDGGAPHAAASTVDLDNFAPDDVSRRGPDARSGRASLDYVEEAVRLVRSGAADAVVTGPISKEAIGAAGCPFPGHTELLADLTGAERPVMLLVNGQLRVAMVTTHMALRDVPEAVTAGAIAATAQELDRGLRRFFGIAAPRIAVCGLNPHCGDGGRFGDEEATVVGPGVDAARASGVNAVGPKPADTAFQQAVEGRYDAVIALYHDQGMIPVKLAGLGQVVNVTLGLPVIRTSVGHGTAYDIAGKGLADERSLVAAMSLARDMVRNSRGA